MWYNLNKHVSGRWWANLVGVTTVFLTGVANAQEAVTPRHPDASIQMVSHRGANLAAPENTFAAAEMAIAQGAAWIEVDVRTSQDGVLYLMHDATVDRTTSGTGPIANMPSDQVDQLDAGAWFDPRFAGQRVPRLREFLEWIDGKANVYLDIKAAEPSAVVVLIRELGATDRVFFWSGNLQLMDAICRLEPDLPHKRSVKTVESMVAADEAWGVEVVEIHPRHLTEAFMAEAKARNIRVMAHLLDDEAGDYHLAVQWGVDLANLDELEVFKQVEARTLSEPSTSEIPIQEPISSTGGVALTRDSGLALSGSLGHSHNDYAQRYPLSAALDADMLSIEADVFLRDGDLYVAHEPSEIRVGRTLKNLYLDRLWTMFQQHGGRDARKPFGGMVRASGRPLILMIDIKSEGAPTWRLLEAQLSNYPGLVREVRRADGGQDEVTQGPVIVVVSGNRPQALIVREGHRRTAIDGRFPSDLQTDMPPHLMPMVSTSYRSLQSEAGSTDARTIERVLQDFAREAAKRGRLARVWGTPDSATAWQAMTKAGMQLINTDQPHALATYLQQDPEPRRAAGSGRAPK